MGEMWLEGERGVLRLDGDARLWWKPHHGPEHRTRLRQRRATAFGGGVHGAAGPRAGAPAQRRAAREQRPRLPAQPARAGGRLPIACLRTARRDGRLRSRHPAVKGPFPMNKRICFRSPSPRPPCSSPFPCAAQTVLKFSHTDQQSGARQAAAQVFAKKVEELHAGPLQGAGLLLQPARQRPEEHRAADRWAASTSRSRRPARTHRTLPTLNLTMMPFLVDSYQQGWKMYDESQWLKDQFAKAPAKGFRFLSTWEAGFRSMTTKHPLNSPERCQGQEAAHLSQRDDALDARVDGLQHPDHAAARGLPRDPAGRRRRARRTRSTPSIRTSSTRSRPTSR